jgi:hypothetical protein
MRTQASELERTRRSRSTAGALTGIRNSKQNDMYTGNHRGIAYRTAEPGDKLHRTGGADGLKTEESERTLTVTPARLCPSWEILSLPVAIFYCTGYCACCTLFTEPCIIVMIINIKSKSGADISGRGYKTKLRFISNDPPTLSICLTFVLFEAPVGESRINHGQSSNL